MTFNKNNEESDGSVNDEPWIQWFCGLKGHEMFCEVERSYIEDGFNLYGLRVCVSNFSDCLDLILDRFGPDEESDDSHITQSACTLYGLIHARYIITAHGLDAMYNKYAAKEFGTCPLIQCGGQPVLPVSLRDEMGVDTVKIYCPKCSQVFHPPPLRSSRSSSNALTTTTASGGGTNVAGSNTGTASAPTTIQSSGVDGAAFGTTFPHLFLMTFSNLVPDPLPPESAYVPRIFGFRIHRPLSSQQQQQRQQRYITNASTTTTTTTNNTHNTIATTTTGSLPQQQQQIQTTTNDNKASTRETDEKDTVAANMELQNDQKQPSAVKQLDVEDNDDDDDDDDDANSQFLQQQKQIEYLSKLPESESVTKVPSLMVDESINKEATTPSIDDSTITSNAKRSRAITEINGGPGSTAILSDNILTNKRRRRTGTNNI